MKKQIHIPKVGGPLIETTEIPPWPSTSSTVRLERAPNFQPDVEEPVRSPTWLALLLLVLGFQRG